MTTPRSNLALRVRELELDVARLRRQLVHRPRFPQLAAPRDVRLALTVAEDDVYPDSGANTFPIVFLDSHFPRAAGAQAAKHTERTPGGVDDYGHAEFFLPKGTVVWALWQRGLGPTNSGEYWLHAAAGQAFVAATTVTIPKRVSGIAGGPVAVQPQTIDAGGTFSDSGAEIDIWSYVRADSQDPGTEPGGKLYIFVTMDRHGTYWFTGEDCKEAGS